MSCRLALIIHNVRSAHNVGSILRTADGLGVETVYMSGYTPYPADQNDNRLLHIAKTTDAKIAKTALGAEKSQKWLFVQDFAELAAKLKTASWLIVGLEQTKNSINLADFKPPDKLALVLGNEKEGLDASVIELCDYTVEIAMKGKKESFNVAEAAAIAAYAVLAHAL